MGAMAGNEEGRGKKRGGEDGSGGVGATGARATPAAGGRRRRRWWDVETAAAPRVRARCFSRGRGQARVGRVLGGPPLQQPPPPPPLHPCQGGATRRGRPPPTGRICLLATGGTVAWQSGRPCSCVVSPPPPFPTTAAPPPPNYPDPGDAAGTVATDTPAVPRTHVAGERPSACPSPPVAVGTGRHQPPSPPQRPAVTGRGGGLASRPAGGVGEAGGGPEEGGEGGGAAWRAGGREGRAAGRGPTAVTPNREPWREAALRCTRDSHERRRACGHHGGARDRLRPEKPTATVADTGRQAGRR